MTTTATLKTSNVWHPFTQAKTADPPLRVRRGRGAILELEDGKQIIDCISSWWVNIHGHCHPEIARAIYEQANLLEHVIFAGFTHEPAELLAKEVLRHLPDHLQHVFFSDNGTTAVEVALKMAYQYWQNKGVTGRTRFIALEEGYHGETVGAMSLGRTMPFFKRFEPLLFEVDLIPFPATWQGDTERQEKEERALSALAALLETHPNRHACILIEPLVQGVGGMRMCSEDFIRSLTQACKNAGLLTIYDEVMTGFGRTGEWFACHRAKTDPDIICLAKGLTAGFMSMALTIASNEIYQSFYSDDLQKALFHSHSYMGNALACTAANASLKLLEANPESFTRLQALHQSKSEEYLNENKRLERLRILGTIFACDVVSHQSTGYFNNLGLLLRRKFLERGCLIRPLGNTIYLMPPYCITEDELTSIYRTIGDVVSSL
ncbi:MAG: adenosylmethionine--8-amino-7-oxononanoate transaminase [Candidatus Melainabacteria bacterium]|nr:MAG: adenosylmethionine--8-amino-7-oxononanoate transaminase [Candidatus Melainabacteria bacterium]